MSVYYIKSFVRTNREDDIMCKILNKLRGKTADELLREYNISTIPPIDISLLLKRIGIKEIPADFTEIENLLECNNGDVLGITYAKGDSLGILYRSSDTSNRKRFTIAHEIAHCCLHTNFLGKKHIQLRSDLTKNDSTEIQANIFAGELLIPELSLRKIHSQFIAAPPLSYLSQIFGVSTNVIAARLDYLKMSYIKDGIISEN